MSHKSIFICIYWQHQVIKHSFSGLLWKLKHFCHCIQKTKQNAVLCSNYCSSSVPQLYMCWVCRVCLCACPFLSIKFANTNTHTLDLRWCVLSLLAACPVLLKAVAHSHFFLCQQVYKPLSWSGNSWIVCTSIHTYWFSLQKR